jgi:hypothetical protein
MIALYFACNPPPDPTPTMDDWRIEATAVCEKEAGPVASKWEAARKAFKKLADDGEAGLPVDAGDISAAGRQYEDAGNTFRAYIGSLRDIEQPPAQAKRINEALDIGSEIASAMAIAGRAFIDGKPEDAKPELIYIGEHEKPYVDRMAALDVPRCVTKPSEQGASGALGS